MLLSPLIRIDRAARRPVVKVVQRADFGRLHSALGATAIVSPHTQESRSLETLRCSSRRCAPAIRPAANAFRFPTGLQSTSINHGEGTIEEPPDLPSVGADHPDTAAVCGKVHERDPSPIRDQVGRRNPSMPPVTHSATSLAFTTHRLLLLPAAITTSLCPFGESLTAYTALSTTARAFASSARSKR